MEEQKLKELLEYEVASSWLVPIIPWDWAQELLSEYYVRRVLRKYRRLKRYHELKKHF